MDNLLIVEETYAFCWVSPGK